MAVNKRKVLDVARKYVQKGAKQKALKEFERLLKLDPKDGKLRLEIGDAHRRWGQTDEAVAQYQKVADQYKSDGFDARAVAVYKQVLNLDPKRYAAHVSLAELYQRMGLDSEAITALQTAADGYHKEGKKREALELLRKMATLDPSNTTSRLKVADLLKQEGMAAEAIAELEAVAEEYERQGTTDQMITVYARILEIEPRRVDILTATARSLIKLERPERAEPFAKKAVAADADNADHYELLCDIYKALERTEELAETTRALARIFRERGDDERAREIIQRLPASEGLDAGADTDGFVSDPDEPEIADEELLDDEFLAGDDEIGLGNETIDPAEAFGDAFDASTPELDASPDPVETEATAEEDAPEEIPIPDGDPDQLLAEANVYLRYGKSDQAIAGLKGVLAQRPDNRDALEKLGEALSETGDVAGALEHWCRAAGLARDQGDHEGLGILCDRISAIDPSAVGDLLDDVKASDDAGHDDEELAELDLVFDEPETAAETETEFDVEADAGAKVEQSSDEEEAFELDLDLEGDDGAGEDAVSDDQSDAPSGTALTSDDEPDPVLGDDGDFEIDLDLGDDSAAEGAGEASGSVAESASSSEQVGEEFEEAEFYYNQGLFDEAEVIYKRILEAAPNHPSARLRMGEIEVARAESSVAPEVDPSDADLEIDFDADSDDSELEGVDEGVAAASAGSVESVESVESALSDESPDHGLEEIEFDLDDADDDSAADGLAADADVVDFDADEPGLDLAEETTESSDALEDDDTEADADGAFEIDLDGSDDSIDLAEAAAEAAAALDENAADAAADSMEDDLSTPTLEQVDESSDSDGAQLTADVEETEEVDEAVTVAAQAEEADDARARTDADETQPITEESKEGEGQRSNEDTFDLAAELREAFEEDEEANSLTGSGMRSTVEDGFESIFSEFKKGVSATLTDADVETRYDLGIAYREMGLYEDAIGEFRICLTQPERMIDGLTMMGLCALDLNRPADAIGHFEQALAGDELEDIARAAVTFDLGRAFEHTADAVRAKAAYEAVAAIDPDFPEIQERIQALAYADSSPSLSVNVNAPIDDGEYESFTDLTGDDDDDEVEEAESFESFDDVLTEAEAVLQEDDTPEVDPVGASELDPVLEAEPESEVAPEPEPAADPTPPAQDDDPTPPKKGRGRKKRISFV